MKALIKLLGSVVLFIFFSQSIIKAQTTIEWEQNYGGSGWDYPRSIKQTINGGYVVAGMSNSSNGDVTGNNGDWDYWIIKLDALGNLQWEKNYGGAGADEARSIQQTIDEGYIVAGWSNSNNGDVSGNKVLQIIGF